MTTGPTPRPHACAVCGLVLSHVRDSDTGEIDYLHLLPGDHLAIPVPVEEIRATARCDFCSANTAEWLLPVEDYELSPGRRNLGGWAACDCCADLIRRGRWSALVSRAKQALERNSGQSLDRSVYQGMYDRLRVHITGPLRRRTDARPETGQ